MSRAECEQTITGIERALEFVLQECRMLTGSTPHLTAAERNVMRRNLGWQLTRLQRQLRAERARLSELS